MGATLPYNIFFAVLLFIAGLNIFSIKLNKPSYIMVGSFVFLLLVCIAGFRWFNVPLIRYDGTYKIFDYTAYKNIYLHPPRIDSNFFSDYIHSSGVSMDIGYVYISSFFSRYITPNFNLFLLIVSLFTISLFYWGLDRNGFKKSSIFLIIFIFICRLYYQYNFIMLRQSIAMAIVWWGIPYIVNKNFKNFALCCLFAGVFHFTGFLFIITYWLTKIKFTNRFLFFAIPITLVCSISGLTDAIILFVLKNSLSLVGLGRLSVYLEQGLYSKGINPLNFVELFPFLFIALLFKEELYNTIRGKFFFNLLIFYTFFMIITMNIMALTRISSYYFYALLFVLSFAYERFNKNNRIVVGLFVTAYFLLYGIRFINANFYTYGYNIFFLN